VIAKAAIWVSLTALPVVYWLASSSACTRRPVRVVVTAVVLTMCTAAFTVESLLRWRLAHGCTTCPPARRLLVTADAGGSNGDADPAGIGCHVIGAFM